MDVEELIPGDHPARAIWDFVGALDLRAYAAKIKSVEGGAGRPAYDPQLLISVWIYSISKGEGSAREIERLCEFDPAYQWLTGMEVINHHSLSDFRIDHGRELDELFTQILGVLTGENLVTLERVTQDGTKIKAAAGTKSFHHEKTIEAHLDEARRQIEAVGDPRQNPENKRREKARQRAANDRRARMEKARKELQTIIETKKREEDRLKARVSETEPECRFMKDGAGGYAPSYNVQLTVDGAHGIIVDAEVSQAITDNGELEGAMARVEARTGARPRQVVVDGGYTNNANIMNMAAEGIDMIGSFKDNSAMVDAQYERRGIASEFRGEMFRYDEMADRFICPAGKSLIHISTDTRRPGTIQHMYRAPASVCKACEHRMKCFPGMKIRGRQVMRTVDLPAITEFRTRMETEEAKAVYRTRSRTAEFPNAWIKEKFGFRRFHVRGKAKAKQEALWVSITYNIQQWIRLIWRPRWAPSPG